MVPRVDDPSDPAQTAAWFASVKRQLPPCTYDTPVSDYHEKLRASVRKGPLPAICVDSTNKVTTLTTLTHTDIYQPPTTDRQHPIIFFLKASGKSTGLYSCWHAPNANGALQSVASCSFQLGAGRGVSRPINGTFHVVKFKGCRSSSFLQVCNDLPRFVDGQHSDLRLVPCHDLDASDHTWVRENIQWVHRRELGACMERRLDLAAHADRLPGEVWDLPPVPPAVPVAVDRSAPVPCAGPTCSRRGSVRTFERCSRCRGVLYCSRACQQAHWRAGHRAVCVPIQQVSE